MNWQLVTNNLSMVLEVLNIKGYKAIHSYLAKLLVVLEFPSGPAQFPAIFGITIYLKGISPMYVSFLIQFSAKFKV